MSLFIRTYLFLSCFLICPGMFNSLPAQPPEREWQLVLGNLSDYEYGVSIADYLDHGYVFGVEGDVRAFAHVIEDGSIQNFTVHNGINGGLRGIVYFDGEGIASAYQGDNVTVAFTSEQGNLIWNHNLDLQSTMVGIDKSQDNTIFCVTTDYSDTEIEPVELLQFSLDGSLVSTDSYLLNNPGVRVGAADLKTTYSNDMLISCGGINNQYILRIDANGDLLSENTVPDYCTIGVTSDDSYYTLSYDRFLRKYDPIDNLLWEQQLPLPYFSPSLDVTHDGGAVVAGRVEQDGWAHRYDAAGNLLWSYETNDFWPARFNDIAADDRGYLCVGSVYIPFGDDQLLPQVLVEKLALDVTDYQITTQPFRQQVPRGGWLPWRGGVKNNLPTTETVDVWVQALKPDGSLTGPIRQWNDLTLQPGDSLSGIFWQGIPDDALLGKYNYLVRIGDWPQHRFEDVFSFEVVDQDAPVGLPNGEVLGDNVARVPRTRGMADDGTFPGFSEAGLHTIPAPDIYVGDAKHDPSWAGDTRHHQGDRDRNNGQTDEDGKSALIGSRDVVANVPDYKPTGWEFTASDWTRHKGHPRKTGLPQVINTSYGPDMNVGGKTFSLQPVYPNPFNNSATVAFTLPRTAPVRAEVFDILGRRVRVLVDGMRGAGEHHLHLSGEGLSSGQYVVTVKADGLPSQTVRVTVVK